MNLDRLVGVLGTRREESAGGGVPAALVLVPADCRKHAVPDGGCGHGRPPMRSASRSTRPDTSRPNSPWSARSAPLCAPIRYQPGLSRRPSRRTSSRSRRRNLFRSTAPPVVRPIAYATWGRPSVGSETAEHHRAPERTRTPSRESRRNTERREIRPIKPRAGSGPWPVGPSGPHAPRAYSSASETRASSTCAGCSAGTFVSWNPHFTTTHDTQLCRTLPCIRHFSLLWTTCYGHLPCRSPPTSSTPCG